MKKIGLILSAVLIVIIISALSLTVSAKWWKDDPFNDVSCNDWYYDTVRICKEQGIMDGISGTEFGSGKYMTRAMFATTLAAASGYDSSAYTEDPFDDVPAGEWYTAAVIWANENGIANGTGDGMFPPNNTITRQEIAVMLYKYAGLTGYDTSLGDTTLDAYPDADETKDWAVEAMRWAVEKGMISGMPLDGKLLLSPYVLATRAQAATMIVRLMQTKPVYEINGNDISLYKIVYDKNTEDKSHRGKENAGELADYIKKSLGIELPLVSDAETPGKYEILVGKTNRDGSDEIEAELEALGDDEKFICTVKGNKLFIIGFDTKAKDGDRDHIIHNVNGTHNAVFYFADEVLGVRTYSQSESETYFETGEGLYEYEPDPVISLEDGWKYIDGPYMRERRFFMSGGILGTGTYMDEETACMSTWISGDLSREDELIHAHMPCLSDEENLKAVIKTVRNELEKKPYLGYLGIGINDTDSYCKCSKCVEAYRKYQSPSATLMLFINKICEDIAGDYPNVKILTGAYVYTLKPPAGITMNDNVIIQFYTIESCNGHAYNDANCPINACIKDYVDRWNSISNELWLWDHCCAFVYSMTPMPDWNNILTNIRYFADSGAKCVLMNSLLGSGSKYSDFGYLRGYALSMVYRDPYMSREEYDYRLNKAIKAYYGDGWENIREYLDLICLFGSAKDHKWHATPGGYYDFAQVRGYADHIDQLWANAEEAAKGNEFVLRRISIAKQSWIFLRQCVMYEPMWINGTAQQRTAYEDENQKLYDFIKANDISWTEGTLNILDQFSPTLPPWMW